MTYTAEATHDVMKRPLSLTDEKVYRDLMAQIVMTAPIEELRKVFVTHPLEVRKEGFETFKVTFNPPTE